MQFKRPGIAIIATLAAALAATPAFARPPGGGASVGAAHNFAAASPSVAGRSWSGRGWSGGGWRHGRGGWGGFGAGLAAGAVIGSAPYWGYGYGDPYYGGDYAYYGDDDYDGDAYTAAPEYAGSASSCAMRYRSYDPATGTYLGYDGIRHPCP